MMTRPFFALLIATLLAACAQSPQPTLYLRPVRQVNLDLMPSRLAPKSLDFAVVTTEAAP